MNNLTSSTLAIFFSFFMCHATSVARIPECGNGLVVLNLIVLSSDSTGVHPAPSTKCKPLWGFLPVEQLQTYAISWKVEAIPAT